MGLAVEKSALTLYTSFGTLIQSNVSHHNNSAINSTYLLIMFKFLLTLSGINLTIKFTVEVIILGGVVYIHTV